MKWPSTDNLYKPIAIFGLVVVIGSAYVVLSKGMDYRRQRKAWSAASWGRWVQAIKPCEDLSGFVRDLVS